jgi:signal transduction histidine kinase
MKSLILFFILFVALPKLVGQQNYIDSLKHELKIAQNDTLKLFHFFLLSRAYEETKPDSALFYAKNELTLAQKLKLRLSEAIALNDMAYSLKNMGNYPASLKTLLSAKEIAEDTRVEEKILPHIYSHWKGFKEDPVTPRIIRRQILGLTHLGLGLLYETLNIYEKGLSYDLESKQNFEEAGNVYYLSMINMILGRVYLSLNQKDSALIFQQKAYNLTIEAGYKENLGGIFLNLGRTYLAMGNRKLASEYFRKAVTASRENNYLRGMAVANLMLYTVYQQEGKTDSSLHFATAAFGIAQRVGSPDLLLRTYHALAEFYRSSYKNDSTVKYQALIINITDSLFNSKQGQQFQNIDFNEQQRQQELERQQQQLKNKIIMYSLLAGLLVFLVIALMLYRNNLHKQNAKLKIEKAYAELKATQAQLIQSEKMASLGELTAGIAHEIQNPLNFVNNFSEVNGELIEEINNESDITEIKAIANDIKQNNEKISFHGKRADAIVKGMLQHSRASISKKEPVDINALADEYLRLSYHGLRAKDKDFNATLQTDFDESIGKINVVPQDIGRVLLNLYNNAFYSVIEKKKQSGDKYEALVSVSTKKENNTITITVRDNGIGIPQKVIDKIFQPFFTTKPTGQGTGLGLSLSYDIIKAHGGEIRLEGKEGEGAEFIVKLPTYK